MSASNFYIYDANHIYVPKAFRDLEGAKNDYAIMSIYDEANEEVEAFLDKLNNILEPLAKKLEKKYKNVEIGVGYEYGQYDRVAKSLYSIEIVVYRSDDDPLDYLLNRITVLKAPGYYWGFSIDYAIERDEIEPPLLEDLTDIIASKIETLLHESFDIYDIIAQFSSGETWYERADDEEEEE